MNRIKKGDEVIVTAGKDKGKRGDVVRVAGDKVVVSNVNIDQAPHQAEPAGQPAGRRDRARSADPCFERDAVQPCLRQGRARRYQGARGWTPSARVPLEWRSRLRPTPETRGKTEMTTAGRVLQAGSRAEADGEVRLHQSDAGAAPDQDHAQHGRGRGGDEQEDPRERGRPTWPRSPARSRRSPSRACRWLRSRSATAGRSAARSRCAARRCTSSWIA